MCGLLNWEGEFVSGLWFGWEEELVGDLWWCMIKQMGDGNYEIQ